MRGKAVTAGIYPADRVCSRLPGGSVRVVTRVGVLSLGKFMGMSSALLALVLAILYAIGILLASVIGSAAGMAGSENPLLAGGMGMGMGLVMAVLVVVGLPIVYGIFGLLFGLV